MEAIFVSKFGGPEVLELKNVSLPILNEREVLVKVLAIGVNPVETYIRSGSYRLTQKLPYIPGRDCAGIIVKVNYKVSKFKPGDLVFTDSMKKGTYAQYYSTLEEDVLPLSKKLSFAQGASFGVGYRTAYRALFEKAKIRKNHCILIRGASGGVGIPSVEMAKKHGCFVVGTASSKKSHELLLNKGVDLVVDHDFDSRSIFSLKNFKGFDVIIEMLANQNLNSDLQLLKMKGKVVIVGNKGKIEICPRDLMMKETSLIGLLGGTKTKEEKIRYRTYLLNGIKNDYFSPIIESMFSLEKSSEAHKKISSRSKSTAGKIIICPFGIEEAIKKRQK